MKKLMIALVVLIASVIIIITVSLHYIEVHKKATNSTATLRTQHANSVEKTRTIIIVRKCTYNTSLVRKLENKIAILNLTLHRLEREYKELVSKYRELQLKFNQCKSDYVSLLINYTKLKKECKSKKSQISITILFDREYYYYLLNDIEHAKHDILIMMFEMKYYPYDRYSLVDRLIDALIEAHERGVKVLVLLEYRTYFGYIKFNLRTYYYLKEHGIDVKLDYDPTTLHDKLVIIDDKIVYIGSHNWTESALKYNHEISVRIVSPTLAKEVEEYFYQIWNSE
ncbi:MAG: hypothetical protein GXO10_04175 [Crenarchaeota archaeon]|nr:hypothetical protein [Thermoproteota archaeon]